MKLENEKKKLEIDKLDNDIKSLKDISLVVTALIKDVEEKAEQISGLLRENASLRHEIELVKEETTVQLKDRKKEFSKDIKELKLVVALIKDKEEIN